MRHCHALVALAVLGFGLAGAMHGAESPDFRDLLSGSAFPLSVKLKELTPEWRRVVANGGAGAGNPAALYAALLAGGASDVFYTQGATVSVGSQSFLVAYREPVRPVDMAALMADGGRGRVPEREALTPETALELALLPVQTLGNLTGIRAFDLSRELADAAGAKESHDALVEATQGARAKAVSVQSMSNLKQLGVAVRLHAADHNDTLPTFTGADAAREALKPYMKDEAVFAHPGTKEPYLPNVAVSGRSIADAVEPAGTVLYYEATPAGDGSRNVLFLDGHVEHVDAKRWADVQKTGGLP